jgi:predicted nucleotidyltransferase
VSVPGGARSGKTSALECALRPALAQVRCSGVQSASMSPLDQLQAVLSTFPEVQLAVLFGSHARGRATRRSDVDVAVALEPDGPEVRSKVWRATLAAVPAADVVFAGDAPPLLRMEIARHGRLLIERRGHAWATFKAKAMIDWGDWAPYARRISLAAVKRLREEIDRGPA